MQDPQHTRSLALSNPATSFGFASDTHAGLESDTAAGEEDLLIGAEIGDVVVEELLAEGGMGRVYRGRQQHPPRPVAIKFTRHGRSRGMAERFHREVELLGRLTHPHIAQVYTAGQYRIGLDTLPYYVLEFVPEAESLTGFCRRRELDVPARLKLFLNACEAIAYGHRLGIVHRDLKPSNLLVSGDEESLTANQPQLKVIDFGIAKALTTTDGHSDFTETGQFLGTRQYMSPEQFDADPEAIDTRSDVYSLGVVLFELLTGQLPYDLSTRSLVETARVVQQQQPSPLQTTTPACELRLRQLLQLVLNRCLAKSPNDRYVSAGELVDDLRRLLAGEPLVHAGQPTSWLRPRVTRTRVVGVLIGMTVAAVAAISMFLPPVADDTTNTPQASDTATLEPIRSGYSSSISSGRTTPLEWLEMYFDAPLANPLTPANFQLTRDGEPLDVSGIEFERLPGGTSENWLLRNLGPLNAREGTYVLTFIDPEGGLVDPRGRPFRKIPTMTWDMPPFTTHRFSLYDDTWDDQVVSMEGLERYTEETANVAATFIRPTEVNKEGTIVMCFPADFEIEVASLQAALDTWTTGDAFPYDPGAWAHLDVSADGQSWTNVITRGPNKGPPPPSPWDISEIVKGSHEVWVRARLTGTKEWPDDGITFTQFLRTAEDAQENIFRLDLTGPHPPLVPDSNEPKPAQEPASAS